MKETLLTTCAPLVATPEHMSIMALVRLSAVSIPKLIPVTFTVAYMGVVV